MSDSDPSADAVIDEIRSSDQFAKLVEELAEHFHEDTYKDDRIPEIKASFREDAEEADLSEGETSGVAGRLIGTLMQRAGEKAPPAPAERLPPGDGPIPEARYEELPGPLVRLLRLIETEEKPFRQAHRLIDAIEWAVKWHTTLALSDLLSETDLPAEVKVLLAHGLRTPSLGLWNKFFRESLNALEDPSLPWKAWERLTTLESKHELVNFRNEYAHGATPPLEECREAVATYLPVLKEMVHTPIFTDVGLAIRGEGAGPQLLRGSEREALGIEIEEGHAAALLPDLDLSGEAPGETPWTERARLDLWPLGLVATASMEHSEDASGSGGEEHPQFFYFNALKNEAVERLNYEEALLDRAPDLYNPFHKQLPLRQWKKAEGPDLERFRDRIEALTEDFVGRREERERLRTFAAEGDGTLMVFGAPGIGKSALLAQVKREIEAGVDLDGRDLSEEMPPVIEYFIRSGQSDDAVPFLRHLCRRLDRRYGLSGHGLGSEPVELNEQLRARLQAIEDEARDEGESPERTLLLVDGLDEGPDLGRHIPEARSWLPVLVASRETEEAQSFYKNREIQAREEMTVGPLSAADVRALLYKVVSKYDPGLTEAYVEAVAERSEGNPLYLQLLAEQLFQGELAVGDTDALPEKVSELYEGTVDRITGGDGGAQALDVLLVLTEAREPLSVPAMAGLLDERSTEVRKGLRTAMELLQRQEGEGETSGRYQLFHETLRTWLRSGDHAAECTAKNEQMAERCFQWTDRREAGARGYALRHAAAHLKAAGRSEDLYELLTDEKYPDAQVRATGQFDATYRAYEAGLQAYVERDGETPEDDARLCRLALDAGTAAREATEGVTQAFRWAEAGRMEDALQRIEVLDEEKYLLAALRLLWIEADRQAERPETERSAEAARAALEALDDRIASGTDAVDWSGFADADFMAWWTERVLAALPALDVTGVLLRTSNNKETAEALAERLPGCENAALLQLGQVALRMAEGIERDLSRAMALSEIATTLGEAGPVAETKALFEDVCIAARGIEWDSDRAEALSDLATALAKAGPVADTKLLFEDVLTAAQGIKREPSRAEALSGIATALAEAGAFAETEALFEDALTAAQGIEGNGFGLNLYRPKALSGIATALTEAGVHEEARDVLRDALAAAQGIEEDSYRAEALSEIATALAGAFTETEVLFEGLLTVAQGFTDEFWRAEALSGIAKALADAGAFAETEALLEDLLTAAQGIGRGSDRAGALSGIATALARAGSAAETEALFEDVLAAAQGIKREPSRAEALSGIAEAVAGAGAFAETKALFDDLLTAAQGIEGDRFRAKALSGIATALAEAGPFAETKALFADVLAAAQGIEGDSNRAEALSEIATALAGAGAFTETEALFENLRAGAQGIEGASDRAKALSGLATVLADAGAFAETETLFEDLLAAARGIEWDSDRAEALSGIAAALAEAGAHEEARDVLGDALITAQGVERDHTRAEVLSGIATALTEAGVHEEARDVLGGALAAAQGIEWDSDRAEALSRIAAAPALAGAFTETEVLFEGLLTVAQGFTNEGWRADALSGIAKALADAGAFAETEALFADVLAAAQGIEGDSNRAEALSEIATALAGAGAHEEARDVLGNALTAAQGINEFWRAEALSDLATALAKAGPVADTKLLFEDVLTAAQGIKREPSRAEALSGIAAALAAAGSVAETKTLFEDVLTVAQGIGDDRERAEAVAEIVTALAEAGAHEEARDVLGDALVAAQGIEGDGFGVDRYQAEVVSDITAALSNSGSIAETRSLFENSLGIAATIEDHSERADALKRIAVAIAQAGDLDEAVAVAAAISDESVQSDAVQTLAEQRAASEDLAAFAPHLPSFELSHNGWTTVLPTWREALLEHAEAPRALLRESLTLYPFDLEAAAGGAHALVQGHARAGALDAVRAIAAACPELGLGALASTPAPPVPEGCDPDDLPVRQRAEYDTYVDLYEEGTLDDAAFESKVEKLFDEADLA